MYENFFSLALEFSFGRMSPLIGNSRSLAFLYIGNDLTEDSDESNVEGLP